MSEEEIRNMVSRMTKAAFEMTDSRRYPISKELVKWFMWCPEITEMREIPYVNVVWADNDDNIHLDSMPIGDTTEWIEEHYGEKGAHTALKMDFSDFNNPDFRNRLNEQFPQVLDLVDAYERIVKDTSLKWRANLEIWYHGRKGIATGRLRSTIHTKKLDTESKTKQIEAAMRALEEAFNLIDKYEATRAKTVKRRS